MTATDFEERQNKAKKDLVERMKKALAEEQVEISSDTLSTAFFEKCTTCSVICSSPCTLPCTSSSDS